MLAGKSRKGKRPFIRQDRKAANLLGLELVMGVGPMNLVITNDALYQLSYTSIIHFSRIFVIAKPHTYQ